MSAGRTPPSPWIGSTMMPAVAPLTALRTAFMLLNGTWSKPSTTWPKTFEVLGVAGGGESGQRPAVERALEHNEAEALTLAGDRTLRGASS